MICKFLFSFFFLCCLNADNDSLGLSHYNGCNVILMNVSTKKSLNLCGVVKESRVKATWGNPISIVREQSDDDTGAKPWVKLKYKGLLLTLEGIYLSELAIERKGWKLNELEIGMPFKNVSQYYKKMERTYEDKFLFRLPGYDGVLVIGLDANSNVNFIGVSSS